MRAERERQAKQYRSGRRRGIRRIRSGRRQAKAVILAEAAREAQVERGKGDAKGSKRRHTPNPITSRARFLCFPALAGGHAQILQGKQQNGFEQ